MAHILDNPIYHSLIGQDKKFNLGSDDYPFFDPEVAPFIGLKYWDLESQKGLVENTPKDRLSYLLINQEVKFIPDIQVEITNAAAQFISTRRVQEPEAKTDVKIIPLHKAHVEEMVALTSLKRPGPFSKRTIEFGNYHGIFLNGKLAAMGGERMHIGDYTEVSAICTHPDFRGLGLGGKITHFITELVYSQGRKPFLHSRADNKNAIEIYKKLGYELRIPMHFYAFRQKENNPHYKA
ncbi:GNAT family N-acetyltransferase [Algoriphagus aestuarii]|nr:GNAT family N-acetyltransferase [Algoriphagus aestuarii]